MFGNWTAREKTSRGRQLSRHVQSFSKSMLGKFSMFLAPTVGSLPEITTLQNHLPQTSAKPNTSGCPARPVLLLQKLERTRNCPSRNCQGSSINIQQWPRSLQHSMAARLSTQHSGHAAGPSSHQHTHTTAAAAQSAHQH